MEMPGYGPLSTEVEEDVEIEYDVEYTEEKAKEALKPRHILASNSRPRPWTTGEKRE